MIVIMAQLAGCLDVEYHLAVGEIDHEQTGLPSDFSFKDNKDDLKMGLLETPEDSDCGFTVGYRPCDFRLPTNNGIDSSFRLNTAIDSERVVVFDMSAMWCEKCRISAEDSRRIVEIFGEEIVLASVLYEDLGGLPVNTVEAASWAEFFDMPDSVSVLSEGSRIIDHDQNDIRFPDEVQGYYATLDDHQQGTAPAFYIIGKSGLIEEQWITAIPLRGNYESMLDVYIQPYVDE